MCAPPENKGGSGDQDCWGSQYDEGHDMRPRNAQTILLLKNEPAQCRNELRTFSRRKQRSAATSCMCISSIESLSWWQYMHIQCALAPLETEHRRGWVALKKAHTLQDVVGLWNPSFVSRSRRAAAGVSLTESHGELAPGGDSARKAQVVSADRIQGRECI